MGHATLNGAPGSTPLRAKGFGTQLQRDRFVCTPYFPKALARSSSVFATSGGAPQRLLSNRQGSTVQRFHFLRLPLDHAQLGQIHDTQRPVRMVEAQPFLLDGQSPRSKGSASAYWPYTRWITLRLLSVAATSA